MPDKKRGLMNFKCDDGKSNNPPCTVLRGDTVYYDVEFAQGIFILHCIASSLSKKFHSNTQPLIANFRFSTQKSDH